MLDTATRNWLMKTQLPITVAGALMCAVAATTVIVTDSARASASEAPIAADRLQALVRAALMGREDRTLHERMAVPLGLTQPGTPYVTRQGSFQEGKATHVIAAHPTSGKVVFMYIENG